MAVESMVALTITGLSLALEGWRFLLPFLAGLALAALPSALLILHARRKQSTLRAERDYLHTILDALPVLISHINADERIIFNNAAVQKWFGRTRQEVNGMKLRDLVGESAYTAANKEVREALAGQPSSFHDVSYEDNGEIWVQVTMIPDEKKPGGGTEGTPHSFVALVKDVTEEKKIEHKLGEVLELNQKILESTSVGVLVYTTDGTCILANQAAGRMAGTTPDQLMQQNFRQTYSWLARTIMAMVQQALENGVSQRHEFHVTTTFGKDLWVDCQLTLLTANAQKHLLFVFDDITERKETEAELARHREHLEALVLERTTDLQAANLQLQQLVKEREQIEQALRESEEHFRLLAEASQDTIFRYDLFPQPHLTYASPAVYKLTGYTAEEHLANPWLALELISLEDMERMAAIMDAPHEHPEPLEVRWRRKDGSYIWAEQRHVPIYDETGTCITVIGVTRDITERRKADEQLRKLSSAVDQSSVSITITDAEGNIEYVNPRFTQVTGFTFEEVRGKKPRVLSPDRANQSDAQLIRGILQSGREWRGELSNITKSGKPYWESGIISPIHNSLGQVTHFLAVMEDVTQDKQQSREREALLAVSLALRAADDSEAMLATVMQEVTATFDADKTFYIVPDPTTNEMIVEAVYEHGVFSSNVAVRIPPDKGVAAHVYRTSVPYVNDDALNDPMFATPDLLGTARAVACVPLIAQGKTIGIFSVARHSPMTNGDVRLLVAIADMAATGLQRAAYHEETLRHAAHLEQEVAEQTRELRQANVRLQELDHLKSKFVSDVSHELRTPVTNMGLYLKLIRRKPEKQEQYLTILQEETERLETLVLDILNLSQLDDKPSMALAPINLNQLLESVVAAHRAKAESRHLELSLQPCATLPIIMGDASKLSQVATNLVANAINYTASGYVRVRTDALDATSVSITVEDSGIGIYAEDMPYLFKRFYRGRRDQITDIPGTGLWLSIVKELVELHGGTIHVASEVARGTTFTIVLPTTPHLEKLTVGKE